MTDKVLQTLRRLSNCYFKQLARKTQELSEVHEYYKELRTNATELADKNMKLNKQFKEKEQELYLARNEVHSKTEYIQEQRDIIKQLEQECEELKEYKAVVDELAGKQIILTNKDKMPKLYENAKDLKLNRYRKALEEIEQHFECRCDICRDNDGLGADCSVCWHKDIRNIISRAKEKTNDR